MKYCPSCNQPNDDATTYCASCGQPFGQPNYSQQPQGYAPPPPQGYAPQPPGYGPQVTKPPGNGMGVAGMVLGIIAIVTCWWGYAAIVSMILAIVGLVLSIMGRKKNAEVGAPAGMATAGLIMSIIALVLSVIVFIACAICVSAANRALNPYYW